MKRLILITLTIFIYSISFSQEGAEHKIINIIGAGKIEINAGKQFNIKIGDIFQIFGKAQLIHPATGKLIERDNVYLGKIKVIEVKELSSIAEQIEKDKSFSVGNKIVKVTSETLPVIEQKKPIDGQFERPNERNYSETIYSSRKKSKVNPKVTVIEERDSNIVLIDKGTTHNFKKNKQFLVYRPKFKISTIDSSLQEIGKKKVGKIKIKDALQNESLVNFKPYRGAISLKKDEYFYVKRITNFEFSLSTEGTFWEIGLLGISPKIGIVYYLHSNIFFGLELSHPFNSLYVSEANAMCFDFKIGVSPSIFEINDNTKFLYFGLNYSTYKGVYEYTSYQSVSNYSDIDIFQLEFLPGLGVFIGSQYKGFFFEQVFYYGRVNEIVTHSHYIDNSVKDPVLITTVRNNSFKDFYINFRIGYRYRF